MPRMTLKLLAAEPLLMPPAAVIPCAISSRISSLLINIFLSMGLSVHTLADRLIDAPPNGGRIHAFPLVLPAVS
jgi:hypothetical protein